MMNKRCAVLVTGGAGYIGSHVVVALKDLGYAPIVIDDLSTGQRDLLPRDVPLIEADIGDTAAVETVMRRYDIEVVMHFAGSVVVPESIEKPLLYYGNNTVKAHALISTCVAAGVGHFIFSSTAAVYGIPNDLPVTEDHPVRPINPYGQSKLMTEGMLRDVAAAHDLTYVALRYFNVAGADPEGRTGQATPRATHLIKVACEAAVGTRAEIEIFGTTFPTSDGTGVRDYVHVADLANAHILALEYLRGGGESLVLNCGYGRGYSVREVVAAVERAAGQSLAVREAAARPGDPPALVAEAARIRQRLGWRPRYDDLDAIVATALRWEKARSRR